MKAIIIFLFIFFFTLPVFSQTQQRVIDSLLHELAAAKEDTGRIRLYTDLAGEYFSTQPDSFFIFCHKGLDLAHRLDQKKDIEGLDLKMSTMLTDTGNYALALKYAEESLSIAQQLDSKPMLINSYCEIGRVYDFQSDFVKSSDYFFKAMAIAQEINNHEKIALIGTNLAADFFNEGNYNKAEEYALITLKEAQLANAPIHIYKAYYTIGMAKNFSGDSAGARDYYNKAIAVCQKNSFVLNEAEVVTDMATLEKNETKLELLMRARKIYDSLSPSSFNSRINWANLGEAYMALFKAHPERKEFSQKAEKYLMLFEKKSEEVNDQVSVTQAYHDLAALNQLKGDYRRAYDFTLKYHAINDSIYSQDNKNKIASLESRHEIEKKNQEIETQKLKVREQRKNTFILLAGLLLMAAIGVLFYRLSTIRKQKNKELTKLNKELDEANKLKARFFGILSHDLRSPIANLVNFLSLRKLKPGALNKEETEERENKIGTAAQSLLETMESMLLWSKSQMQNFKPEITTVSVNNLFSYLKKMFTSDENILFSFFNEDDMHVTTDENYLRTIMYNLTANAVKALGNTDDAKIEWKAWVENGQSFLSISDNGPGIDHDKLKALYDETAASGSKHGLGLHIIRDLAKAIHCNIELQKNVGRGAIFVLSV